MSKWSIVVEVDDKKLAENVEKVVGDDNTRKRLATALRFLEHDGIKIDDLIEETKKGE